MGGEGVAGRSEVAIVANDGHFLQLDQPDVVAKHIVDFMGQAR